MHGWPCVSAGMSLPPAHGHAKSTHVAVHFSGFKSILHGHAYMLSCPCKSLLLGSSNLWPF